ncbi:MAG: response regulator [Myxococcota bacterium]|nr:response regulator [Myxococcota bacterium]
MATTHVQHGPGACDSRACALCEVSVLVIDDDCDTHELLDVLLSHAGYSVMTASNGQEALELLRAIRPRMILLDVEMPVMTGPEFREAQRRDQELIRIPTVVMTGSREEPVLDPGVAEVLHKPFRATQLLSLVRRLCDDPPRQGAPATTRS